MPVANNQAFRVDSAVITFLVMMARHYSSRADRSRKMENVVKNFDLEENRRRTKIVKL